MKNDPKKKTCNQVQDSQSTLVFLICGNDGVGKKSIINEWKRKMKFEKEENKKYYNIYYFIVEHRVDDILIEISLEIRVLNGILLFE